MRKIIFILGFLILGGCQISGQLDFKNVNNSKLEISNQEITQKLAEYCFIPDDYTHLGASLSATRPDIFLQQYDYVKAAINGVYFGADDDKPQGIVYFNGQHLATKKGQITGYFSIDKRGQVKTSEYLTGAINGYQLVIGTHPLLLSSGKISSQALADRYNRDAQKQYKLSYRSAIGTKDKKNICFAVSDDAITMKSWAEQLKGNGYSEAINLDGGTISQLAVRQDYQIKYFGGGILPTRLILFAY